MTEPTERFWAKVDKTGECWVWTGRLTHDGYGQFWDGEAVARAHRFAFGRVPSGFELHHICENRACVRPEHLQVVTHRENIRWSQNHAGKKARQTECSRGHPFNLFNTRFDRGGGRHCRLCQRIYNQEHRKQKREYDAKRRGKSSVKP